MMTLSLNFVRLRENEPEWPRRPTRREVPAQNGQTSTFNFSWEDSCMFRKP